MLVGQQVNRANIFLKGDTYMNSYDEAVKNALQKVFESIAISGCPTPEQVKFIELYKPKKTRTLDDEIKDAEKLFALVFGTDLGGKK